MEEQQEPTEKDILIEFIKHDYSKFMLANEEEPGDVEKQAWQHGFISGYKRGLEAQADKD